MPATATITTDTSLDLEGVKPLVDFFVGEAGDAGQFITASDTYCTMVQYVGGAMPGTAHLKTFVGKDMIGPVTLNRYGDARPYGTRIRVYVPGKTTEDDKKPNDKVFFLGSIMKRRDSGKKDEVIYVAHDDRELLSNLVVRGCVVADTDQRPIYNRRYVATFNAGGLWNMTPVKMPGLKNVVDGVMDPDADEKWGFLNTMPVFAPYASIGRSYESPVEATTADELKVGKNYAWTGRTALQYLFMLANAPWDLTTPETTNKAGDTLDERRVGFGVSEWRCLSESRRLYLSFDDIKTMNGMDPESPGLPDFLDRKLPEVSIRGDTFPVAISKILAAAGGMHSWHVVPMTPVLEDDGETPKPGAGNLSTVRFFPTGANATVDEKGQPDPNKGVSIPLQRGGTIGQEVNADGEYSGSMTIHDFEVNEDATGVRPHGIIDGAPVHAETMLTYLPGADYKGDKGSLVQAWSLNEAIRFQWVIKGSEDLLNPGQGGDKYYAMIPPTIGDVGTPFHEWEPADGKKRDDGTDRPYALANSPAAAALARAYYPTVFIAFHLNPDHDDVKAALNGVENIYAGLPQMKHNRPVLTEQLSYMLMDPNMTSSPMNWLIKKLPVRFAIQNTEGGAFADLVPTPTMEVAGDGTIYLRGIAEELDHLGPPDPGSWAIIYRGSIFSSSKGMDPTGVHMKSVRMNVAFPMDHRVSAYKVGKIDDVLDSDLINDIGGRPLLYIDNPTDSYNEGHQINSSPSQTHAFPNGSANETMPLNRYAPPGTEYPYALAHISRRVAYSQKPERKSTWRLPWIRTEYPLGVWVNKIAVFGAGPATPDTAKKMIDKDYVINAAVMQVTLDFNAQETTLAGLAGAL